MGKRKRSGRSAKAAAVKRSSLNDGFTKEEEEEPLSVHLSPLKSRRLSKKNVTQDEEDEETKHAESENETGSNVNDDMDDDDIEEEDEANASKYEPRQKVLARDEDGLLYHAHIRRKLCGINHQKAYQFWESLMHLKSKWAWIPMKELR